MFASIWKVTSLKGINMGYVTNELFHFPTWVLQVEATGRAKYFNENFLWSV